MEVIKRGNIKREVVTFQVLNYEVANIIIGSLVDKGFNIVSKPIRHEFQTIGEQITVYHVE